MGFEERPAFEESLLHWTHDPCVPLAKAWLMLEGPLVFAAGSEGGIEVVGEVGKGGA